MKVLQGEFKPGHHIRVTAKGDRLDFSVKD
jgi:hypothetical protein